MTADRKPGKLRVNFSPKLEAQLFEDAIRLLVDRFPAQSGLVVPQDPLVCTKPLSRNQVRVIEPGICGTVRF